MERVARPEARTVTTLALGWLAPVLVAAQPALAATAPDQPAQVAKGDGYVVHALVGPRSPFFAPQPPTTPTVFHTVLPEGRLRVLYRSGTTVGIPVPMGIDRTPYHQTRVVGVAADAERLYVLVWSTKWMVLGAGDLGAGPGPPASDAYELRVFWLADGSLVGAFPLGGTARPRVVPRESVEAGPLEVMSGGVWVYGESLRFRGKDRVDGPGLPPLVPLAPAPRAVTWTVPPACVPPR
jgi:hypothetical protein